MTGAKFIITAFVFLTPSEDIKKQEYSIAMLDETFETIELCQEALPESHPNQMLKSLKSFGLVENFSIKCDIDYRSLQSK